jgi:hypothetical protein
MNMGIDQAGQNMQPRGIYQLTDFSDSVRSKEAGNAAILHADVHAFDTLVGENHVAANNS